MVDDDAKDCQYSDSDWCNFSYGPGMHYIWINWLPTSPTLSFSKKKSPTFELRVPFSSLFSFSSTGSFGFNFKLYSIILVANPIIVLWWYHFPLLLGKECMCECELFWLLDFSFFNSRNHIKKNYGSPWSIEVILYV